jgi:putative ABC transport system permease protein
LAGWRDVSVLTAQQERDVLVNGRLWRLRLQILFFVSLLLTVTGVVIVMSIYSATIEKLHQIAMLKLIGARDSFIFGMIMQQSFLVGISAFAVAVALSHATAPFFPRRLVFLPEDLAAIFGGLMLGSLVGSWFGIGRALRVRAQEILA